VRQPIKCECGSYVEPEREALGLDICYECAKAVPRVKGFVSYDKTAGELSLLSAHSWTRFRSYSPYGKLTGRGSGVHRMSRPTDNVSVGK